MKTQIQISIIIPTYNRPKRLDGLLSSVCAKELDKIEIIVVDDCSTNENKNILRSIQKKYITSPIKFIWNEVNKGGGKTRNIGAAESSGEWIWFIDDDDLVTHETILNVVVFVTQKPKFSLLFLKCRIVDARNSNIITPQCVNLKEHFSKYGNQINTSCAIFSRSLYERLEGWDDKLVAGQDTDLFLRAAQLTDAELIPKCIVTFVLHDDMRITGNPKKQVIGKYQFLVKNWHLLSWRRRGRYVLTFVFLVPLLRRVVSR